MKKIIFSLMISLFIAPVIPLHAKELLSFTQEISLSKGAVSFENQSLMPNTIIAYNVSGEASKGVKKGISGAHINPVVFPYRTAVKNGKISKKVNVLLPRFNADGKYGYRIKAREGIKTDSLYMKVTVKNKNPVSYSFSKKKLTASYSLHSIFITNKTENENSKKPYSYRIFIRNEDPYKKLYFSGGNLRGFKPADKNGRFILTCFLKHGESLTIKGLDDNAQVTVHVSAGSAKTHYIYKMNIYDSTDWSRVMSPKQEDYEINFTNEENKKFIINISKTSVLVSGAIILFLFLVASTKD